MPKKKKRKDVLTFEIPLATTLEQAAELLGGWQQLIEAAKVLERRAKMQESFAALDKTIGRGELSPRQLLEFLEGPKPKRKK